MKKIILCILCLFCVNAFGQTVTVVIEKSHIEIGDKVYHGTPKKGRFANDVFITYYLSYPLVLKNADIETVLPKAKKVEVVYTDDNGKRRKQTYLGAIPKVKDKMVNVKKSKKVKVPKPKKIK